MIARLWSAHTTRAQAPAYAEHLRKKVLPELRGIAGYSSVMLLERTTASDVELVVVTFWESLSAIQAFSGPELEEAVVADEAAAILNTFDRRVRHYELILQEGSTTVAL